MNKMNQNGFAAFLFFMTILFTAFLPIWVNFMSIKAFQHKVS